MVSWSRPPPPGQGYNKTSTTGAMPQKNSFLWGYVVVRSLREAQTRCSRERGCLQSVFLTEYMGSGPGSLGRKGGLDLAVAVGAFQERPVECC